MGNLDTKLAPYYAIVDENATTATNSKPLEEMFTANSSFNSSLWSVKKANFNDNKNSILFEFNYAKHTNDAKKVSVKHINLALNQIKKLKVLRHPNVVKYLYSEEPQNLNLSTNHLKCILITESIRPLTSIVSSLSKEQIISGIFGITNALAFLHDKAFISHNNINTSCIYLNTKQVWKLNDFELALNFADLNRENLRAIYEFKNKNAVTPEEELSIIRFSSTNGLSGGGGGSSANKYDLDVVYKEHPHAIDSYAWAMLVFNLITAPVDTATAGTGVTNDGKNNTIFYHMQHKQSSLSITSIIDNEEHEDKYCLEELEKFLNKDPALRPTFSYALNMNLFDLYNNSTANSMNSSFNEYLNCNETTTAAAIAEAVAPGTVQNINGTTAHFDPFKIDNLDALEANWSKLVNYLMNLTQSESTSSSSSTATSPAKTAAAPGLLSQKKTREHLLNEKLVDLLLSPFMFFSEKVTKNIFPSVFIPKGELRINNKRSFDYLKNFMLSNGSDAVAATATAAANENTNGHRHLEPFMDLSKYKVFVLPRILNLFSMHSTQIRLVLLEYFPFYITLVNDLDTLKYEILPELLLGLKDKNDQLVSLTFCCLSIMVQLLGSEVVVGPSVSSSSKRRSNQPPTRYFSDNIPKTIMHNVESQSNPVIKITKAEHASHTASSKLSSLKDKRSLLLATSFDEDLMNIIGSNDETVVKADKIFSDSMIALHDETGSTNDLSSILSKTESKSYSMSNQIMNGGAGVDEIDDDGDDIVDEENDEDWSNDFGWSHGPDSGVDSNVAFKNEDLGGEVATSKSSVEKEKAIESASLVSLMGSELLDKSASQNESASYSGSTNSQPVVGTTTTAAAAAKANPASRLVGFVPSAFNNDQSFAHYDIKNLNAPAKKPLKSDPSDDLIENFLNEITPKIDKKLSELDLNGGFNSSKSNKSESKLVAEVSAHVADAKQQNGVDLNVLNEKMADKNAVSETIVSAKWDCDEIIDLDQ